MRKKSMNKAVKGLSLALALSMGLSFVPGFSAERLRQPLRILLRKALQYLSVVRS